MQPFNLHASLLPQYRGAAPINWAVINGEKETGATTFFLTHEIDTGKIIKQIRLSIGDDENVGSVHDRLMKQGATLVTDTVDAILQGDIEAIDQSKFYQSESDLKAAPKIVKETCRIDWNAPVHAVYNLIRGMSPYPAAWSEFVTPEGEQLMVKILEAQKIEEPHTLPAGSIRTDGKSSVDVAAEGGFIRLKNLQLAGKKRMEIKDLLNGFKITDEFKLI